MKKIAALLCLIIGFSTEPSWGQSSPGLQYGQVPTAVQWNSYFMKKQDYPVRALTLSDILGSTQCLQVNSLGLVIGTGAPCGGSGGTPGGTAFQVQYNNAGAFGGVGPGTIHTVLHGNASGAPSYGPVDLTIDVTGILPAANGGAGTTNGILQANGSGTIGVVTVGAGCTYIATTLSCPGTGTAPGGSSGDLQMNDGAGGFSASHLNDSGSIISSTESINTKTNALYWEMANAASTGTTVNKTAKFTGAPSTAVIAGTSDTTGIVGIVAAGAGTTGTAKIAVAGQVSCVFDGATTAGDFVIASVSVAGDCHDAGATDPTGVSVLGNVLSTNGSGGTYGVMLYPPSVNTVGTTGNPGGGNGGVKIGTLTSPQVTCASGPKTITNCSDQNFAYLDVAQSWTKAQRGTPVTLSISTSTFTPNFDTGQNFQITLVHASCPCTLANPSTTLVPGQTGVIEVIQSATGSDTIGTWGSSYVVAGGTSAITLSTGASAKDYFSYYVNPASSVVLSPPMLNAVH